MIVYHISEFSDYEWRVGITLEFRYLSVYNALFLTHYRVDPPLM